jgi:hypothetical protein
MDVENVVETLAGLGFFRLVPALKQREVREATAWTLRVRRSLDGRIDLDAKGSWEGNRFFLADAESLAEIPARLARQRFRAA